MLAVYRRHSKTCPHQSRRWTRCDCPLWCEGTVEGAYIRESLKTRNWSRATVLARERESAGAVSRKTTVKQAIADFISDCKIRNLRPASLYKHELLTRRLQAFCDSEGIHYVGDLDIDAIRRFRATLKHRNYAAKVTAVNLRAFVRFCCESGWSTVKRR
jgi:hypothetical protein